MAIVIDESNHNYINRDELIEATNCVGNRYLAFWLDYALLFLIFFPITLIIEIAPNFAFLLPVFILFACLYFPVFEGIKGWTIGKYICRIRVIDIEGNPPGLIKATIRTLLRIVEANPLLIGGVPAVIAVCISKRHQRIGDKFAKTYVVKSKSLIEILKKQSEEN
jgi:uncharacterized RDD family membrane protein YckC